LKRWRRWVAGCALRDTGSKVRSTEGRWPRSLNSWHP